MKTYKEHQIILLATEEKTSIKLGINNLLVSNTLGYDSHFINQSIHILSDEEIKEGDWRIDIFMDNPKPILSDKEYKNNSFTKKIIASTDTLGITTKSEYVQFDTKVEETKLTFIPQIPNQFIEQYIESYNKGNIIDKVMVEYEEVNDFGEPYTFDDLDFGVEKEYKLKVNPDNTINIKLKQKEIYSREEVEKLILSIVKDISYGDDFLLYHYDGDFKDAKQWIEQNLK